MSACATFVLANLSVRPHRMNLYAGVEGRVRWGVVTGYGDGMVATGSVFDTQTHNACCMGGGPSLIFLQLDPYPLASIDSSKHCLKPPLREKNATVTKRTWMIQNWRLDVLLWDIPNCQALQLRRTHFSSDWPGFCWTISSSSTSGPVCLLICERWGLPGYGLLYLTTPQARSLSGVCVQAGETEIWAHKRLKFSIFDCFSCVFELLQWLQPDEFSLN